MPVTNVSVVTELFFFCYVSDVASYIVPIGVFSLSSCPLKLYCRVSPQEIG